MADALEQAFRVARRALEAAERDGEKQVMGWHGLTREALQLVLNAAGMLALLQSEVQQACMAHDAGRSVAEVLLEGLHDRALWVAVAEERITLDVSRGTLVHEHGRLEDVVRWAAYDNNVGRCLASECPTAREAALRAIGQLQAERETAAQATAAEAARTTVYDEVPGV